MKEQISKGIRKMRAQTLWDAFGREMTPFATKALSAINPSKVPVDPVIRSYPRGGVSMASSTLRGRESSPWGFNQQLDFVIRILQDGLYCLTPDKIEETIKKTTILTPQGNLPSMRFSTFTTLLQQHAPFEMSHEVYDKIDQIVPESFAYDDERVKDKGDRTRLYKLVRILFFLRHFENAGETAELFSRYFNEEVAKVLIGYKKPVTFSPTTKTEQQELFTRLNIHFDHSILERSFIRAVNKYCPKSADQIEITKKKRTIPAGGTQSKSQEHDPDFIIDGRHSTILSNLYAQLEAGHYSLVGGRDYTRMRVPESALKLMAHGQYPVLVIEGTLEEAYEYVGNYYTHDAKDILEFQVCGQYGNFAKVYVKYQIDDEIKELFFIAQRGQSRVLSNAASLLLYAAKKDEDGRVMPFPKFIPPQNIICVYRREPLNDIIRNEIIDLLDRTYDDATLLGEDTLGLETVVMPATSAETIVESFKEKGFVEQWTEHAFETIGKVSVIVIKDTLSNRHRRVIMPAVGGSGLYGDTAGIFVGEYLKLLDQYKNGTRKLNLSPKIKFFATAGAIPNSSFAPHEGSLCSPSGSVYSYDFSDSAQVKRDPILDGVIKKIRNQFWAPCPAVETSAMFDVLEQHPEIAIELCDVEGLPISKAVVAAQALGIDASFSPSYYVSDLIKRKESGFDSMKPDFDSYAYGCRAGMAIRLSDEQISAMIEYIFV